MTPTPDTSTVTSVDSIERRQKRNGGILGALFTIGFFTMIVVLGVTSCQNDDGGGSAPKTDELRYGAFDVCKSFVKDRLKSPGSAKFRNFFEKDGEVVVRSTDGVNYVVTSTVDSQNGFGALLRTSFVCSVAHVSGTQWRLVDINIV